MRQTTWRGRVELLPEVRSATACLTFKSDRLVLVVEGREHPFLYTNIAAWGVHQSTFVCAVPGATIRFVPSSSWWSARRTRRNQANEVRSALNHWLSVFAEESGASSYEAARQTIHRNKRTCSVSGGLLHVSSLNYTRLGFNSIRFRSRTPK